MTIATCPAATDLLLPRPGGADWDPHTIHTHYFGLSVPEAAIGVFVYLRCQPVFGLSSGGVCVFQGLDNLRPLDIEHLDYVVTMPWPEVAGDTIETANGLSVEFTEPGRQVRLRYRSADGGTSLDVTQTAVSPLLARGHVMPGEDEHTDPTQMPGGSEQFMHCTGELVVGGVAHAVDCHPIRDRSWRQVRTEAEVVYPPVAWTPMCFGDDLMFNQVGFEAPDTDPAWKGLFEVPPGRPAHHFGWVYRKGEPRPLVSVRRRVLGRHPGSFGALAQEIEAADASGDRYRFRGEAIAMAHLPSWPNGYFLDSVYRWEDGEGRVTHCTAQEAWYHTFHRAMRGHQGDGA